MDTYKQIQQLDSLVSTINNLLADSTVAEWHSAVLFEAKSAFSQIQQKAVISLKENLLDRMIEQLADVEREIHLSLEPPLNSLCRLVEENNLSPDLKSQLLIQVGKTYDILGQWNQALDIFTKSLDFCTDGTVYRAEIIKYLGHIKSKLREYSSATKLYLDSLAIYTTLQNKHEIGNIYLCQGYNDFEQGNYGQAEDYYQLALKLATAEEDNQLIADCNNNLGIMATVKGVLDDAITYYQKAISGYESIGDIPGRATTYHNQAMLKVDMENWKDAGESYQRALEYAQQAGNLELMGLIQLNRAELAIKLYDYTMAKACCDHALAVFGRLSSHTRVAEAYKFLGRVASQQKRWDEAKNLFEISVQINYAAQNPLGIAETRYEYGLMYLSQGLKDNAKQQFTQALKLFDKLGASLDMHKVKAELEKLEEGKEDKASKLKRIVRIQRG
ncbi:tetratricopeptide repeat protein [Candidatus Poribacteria bacterium]|nr:tetratricopeptide repeat protein [Candidatus Poribacteria bacterium]